MSDLRPLEFVVRGSRSRCKRKNIFVMAVDTYHRYSNESERANMYDVFELKATLPWFMQKYFSPLTL